MEKADGSRPTTAASFKLTVAFATVMDHAHRCYDSSIGVRRDLRNGILPPLLRVLEVAASHGYVIPNRIDKVAECLLRSGGLTFLHGDLAPENLMVQGNRIRILDSCGYLGPSEFDAARWCARIGGTLRSLAVLQTWLRVERSLDAKLCEQLLGLELLMEGGVREIVKTGKGLPWQKRDGATIALLAAGSTVLGLS